MSSKKTKEPVDDFGIHLISISRSWAGCIVKFWMHDKGWEYQIDGAMYDHVKRLADRSPGGAFNYCKKVAIETFGPYNLDWELIDEIK